MSTHGLLINRLAIQARSDETGHIKGLLCLKISLPIRKDESQGSRWGLFSGQMPNLAGSPTIHTLPIPPQSSGSSTAASKLSIALKLLGLTYAAARGAIDARRPRVDVSSTTGQVYVVVDPSSPTRPKKTGRQDERQECLVMMDLEAQVEETGDGLSSVSLPLPKCLHNVVRFHFAPPAGSSQESEVSVITEPKMHPLDPGTFGGHAVSTVGDADRHAGGWSDGDISSDGDWEDAEAEESGSWLEGRFQCTDALKLQWSFSTPPAESAHLQIMPRYDKERPSVHISYESVVASETRTVEIVLPNGWGWADLSFAADGLIGWRCADGEWWDRRLSATAKQADDLQDLSSDTVLEDSFSKLRNRSRSKTPGSRPSSSAASLLHQGGPVDIRVEDFSFEMGSMEDASPPRPMTPGRDTSTRHVAAETRDTARTVLSDPTPGRLFELDLRHSTSERQLVIEGLIVPLSRLTLVHRSVPVAIPTFRIDGVSLESTIDCPDMERFAHTDSHGGQPPSGPGVTGAFRWTSHVNATPPEVTGDLRIRVANPTMGRQTVEFSISAQKHVGPVSFAVPLVSDRLRLTRATSGSRAVPRAVVPRASETLIFIDCKGRAVDIAYELDVADVLVLPVLESASGTATVTLDGPHWRDSSATWKPAQKRSVKKVSSTSFAYAMNTQPVIALVDLNSTSMLKRARRFTLFSWSMLLNLSMLWLLLSLGQRVQRLRSEVAFVAAEARDLRMYAIERADQPHRAASSSSFDNESGAVNANPSSVMPTNPVTSREENGESITSAPEMPDRYTTRDDASSALIEVRRPGEVNALGRVVFGAHHWEHWVHHPTLVNLSKSIRWLWTTVVRLVVP